MASLDEIATEARQQSPVFIVGEARSGTSILLRMLQKLPNLRPKTLNLAESRVLDHPCRSQLFANSLPSGMAEYMGKDEAQIAAFIETIRPIMDLHRRLRWPPNARLARKSSLWWQLTRNDRVIQAFFHHAKAARGCVRIIEKTPSNTLHLKKLHRAFPKCRMLYIHRHPLDVYSSYRRRHEKEQTSWTDITPHAFCKLYRRGAQRALAFAIANPERLRLVSYEGFTADPISELASICAFIGEDAQEAAFDAPDSPGWDSSSDPHLFQSVTSRTKNWSRWVPPRTAEAIQARLRPTMVQLGYDQRES